MTEVWNLIKKIWEVFLSAGFTLNLIIHKNITLSH